MNAKFFDNNIPNVNNVYFSPSFMMKGNKLKYVTNTGEIKSSDACFDQTLRHDCINHLFSMNILCNLK